MVDHILLRTKFVFRIRAVHEQHDYDLMLSYFRPYLMVRLTCQRDKSAVLLAVNDEHERIDHAMQY